MLRLWRRLKKANKKENISWNASERLCLDINKANESRILNKIQNITRSKGNFCKKEPEDATTVYYKNI